MNYIIKDGELYHWKYIKKKRVNGKWRYYYDPKVSKSGKKYNPIQDLLGMDEKDNFEDAAEDVANKERKANSLYENAHRVNDAITRKYYDAAQTYNNGTGLLSERSKRDLEAERREIVDPMFEKYKDTEKAYNLACKNFMKAKESYFKTPMGVLYKMSQNVKNVVNAGKSFIENLFRR